MHLSKREIFHSYVSFESFSQFLAFLLNHREWRAKKCSFIWSSDRPEPELRDRCSWEKLIKSQILKGIHDKNTVVPKYFFNGFQRWNDGLLRGIKISVVAFWQGKIFDLKVLKYLDESKSKNTVVYLPLLIDKPLIKLTDTCVGYLLRM